MNENPTAYLVAVAAPLGEALTYLPPEDGQVVERGQSVIVPLGSRQAKGVVLKTTSDEGGAYELKPMYNTLEQRPILPAAYMDWLEWLSTYYLHPLGPIVESMFPPLERTPVTGARKSRLPPVVRDHAHSSTPPPRTEEQSAVLLSLQAKADFQVHLLHGVTGSGKTEVYLQLLKELVEAGKQGLVLVPEIALTPQLIDRFSRRFPGQVAVLHSHLTERERTNQWWGAVTGAKKILIGARSALFCPLPQLSLIILDEEHEPSYKQDEKLKYHARDAAIVLARNLNIPIVLGSATPSLESWNNVQMGKYVLHTMAQRVNARPLPHIEVVDLRDQSQLRKDAPSALPFWLSDRLHAELLHTFAKQEQAALFLNRRGVAQNAQCRGCGFAPECPNCSVSMTVHGQNQSHLVCHYCDYSERLTELCPNCKDQPLEPLGLGTEKIEREMAVLFPQARVARADRDEVQTRSQLEALIQGMEKHEIDLLIGTQMIAKGLDFPRLNLVGLVLADVGFNLPDFRASERSFQLLTQMAGRSGRQAPGKVIIQTYNPTHPSIQFTLSGDFKGFSALELTERRELHYPPAWRMALFRIHGRDVNATETAAKRLVDRARTLQQRSEIYVKDLLVLGPARAPLFKLRGKFRFQMIVKCATAQHLNYFCRQLLVNKSWLTSGTKVQVDIDPFQML